MFSTPQFSQRKLELQLVNNFIGAHDLVCSCNNPGFHSLLILGKQIGPELNQQDKQQIKQCLGSDDTATADTADLDFGDLEKLFAEDTEDAAG